MSVKIFSIILKKFLIFFGKIDFSGVILMGKEIALPPKEVKQCEGC